MITKITKMSRIIRIIRIIRPIGLIGIRKGVAQQIVEQPLYIEVAS